MKPSLALSAYLCGLFLAESSAQANTHQQLVARIKPHVHSSLQPYLDKTRDTAALVQTITVQIQQSKQKLHQEFKRINGEQTPGENFAALGKALLLLETTTRLGDVAKALAEDAGAFLRQTPGQETHWQAGVQGFNWALQIIARRIEPSQGATAEDRMALEKALLSFSADQLVALGAVTSTLANFAKQADSRVVANSGNGLMYTAGLVLSQGGKQRAKMFIFQPTFADQAQTVSPEQQNPIFDLHAAIVTRGQKTDDFWLIPRQAPVGGTELDLTL